MDEQTPITFYDVTVDLTPVHEACTDIAPAPSRDAIVRLQEALIDLPQIDLEPRHQFCSGMYVRTLEIPAGSVVVGKTHRHEHPVMLTKGRVSINTDRGMETISAPYTWMSPAGAKRVLYTHEDCEFITVHLNPDDERDLEKIEAYVIEPEAIFTKRAELPAPDTDVSEFTEELQRMYA